MAFKRLRVGPLGIAVTANEHAAGFHVSFEGSSWRDFARGLKERRAKSRNNARGSAAAGVQAEPANANDALQRRIDAIKWYHTLDLGDGVFTPGRFDHGPILGLYCLPERMDGLRVLDVATFDGYWAFEFERRGAKEVVALDLDNLSQIDWSPQARREASPEELAMRLGAGFELAHQRLGSKVQRVVCNVYDLTPERYGEFDIVHSGDVLLHLAQPVKALQNMARVCRGYALISDVYFPELDSLGAGAVCEYRGFRDKTWWRMSLAALQQMVLDAGFARVEVLNKFEYGYSDTPGRWQHAVIKAYK